LGGMIGCGVRTDGTVKCWNLEPLPLGFI
jgi:hypothetical protein